MTLVTREAQRHVDAIDGLRVPVALSGPVSARCVVMIEEDGPHRAAFDDVRRRLHVAMLRTVVVPADPRLTAKALVRLLDQLSVPSALLVGDRSGGELAWSVAAAEHERFTGLVVIDAGHPCVPGEDGTMRDNNCPAVQTDTTALVSSSAMYAVAAASRRHVCGDYRLVELAGLRSSRHFTAQLATEIVLRSLSR